MIKLLLLAHALAQLPISEKIQDKAAEGYSHGGFEAVAWVELGGIIALGAALVWREKQHRADVAAKDNELRDLNKITRDTLISDSKAIESIAAALKVNTDVVQRLIK